MLFCVKMTMRFAGKADFQSYAREIIISLFALICILKIYIFFSFLSFNAFYFPLIISNECFFRLSSFRCIAFVFPSLSDYVLFIETTREKREKRKKKKTIDCEFWIYSCAKRWRLCVFAIKVATNNIIVLSFIFSQRWIIHQFTVWCVQSELSRWQTKFRWTTTKSLALNWHQTEQWVNVEYLMLLCPSNRMYRAKREKKMSTRKWRKYILSSSREHLIYPCHIFNFSSLLFCASVSFGQAAGSHSVIAMFLFFFISLRFECALFSLLFFIEKLRSTRIKLHVE